MAAFHLLPNFFCSETNHIFSCAFALHYLGFLICVTDCVTSLVYSTFGCWNTHLTVYISSLEQKLQGMAALKEQGPHEVICALQESHKSYVQK